MKMAVYWGQTPCGGVKSTEASEYSVCSLVGVDDDGSSSSSSRQPASQLYRLLVLGLRRRKSLAAFRCRLAIRTHKWGEYSAGVPGCCSYMTHYYNKTSRCTNFSNLSLEWNCTCFGQFFCPSSEVFHCTHSNGICHTACEQEQDGTVARSWSCSQAVWHIPLLCVQWKTPDDGQRNCPKHAEFYSKK